MECEEHVRNIEELQKPRLATAQCLFTFLKHVFNRRIPYAFLVEFPWVLENFESKTSHFDIF
jgi:hypothetical protein